MAVEAPERPQANVVGMISPDQADMLGDLTNEQVGQLSGSPETADLTVLAVREALGNVALSENDFALIVRKDKDGNDVPAGYVSLGRDVGTRLNPGFNPDVFKQNGLDTPELAYQKLMAAKEAAAKQAEEEASAESQSAPEAAQVDASPKVQPEVPASEAESNMLVAPETDVATSSSEEHSANETPEGQAAIEAANTALERAQAYIETANNIARSDLAEFDEAGANISGYMNRIEQARSGYLSGQEAEQLSLELRQFTEDLATQLHSHVIRDSDRRPLAQVEIGAIDDPELRRGATQDLDELREAVAPLGVYDERYATALMLTDRLHDAIYGYHMSLSDTWEDLQHLMTPLYDLVNAAHTDLARTTQAQEIIDRIKSRLAA